MIFSFSRTGLPAGRAKVSIGGTDHTGDAGQPQAGDAKLQNDTTDQPRSMGVNGTTRTVSTSSAAQADAPSGNRGRPGSLSASRSSITPALALAPAAAAPAAELADTDEVHDMPLIETAPALGAAETDIAFRRGALPSTLLTAPTAGPNRKRAHEYPVLPIPAPCLDPSSPSERCLGLNTFTFVASPALSAPACHSPLPLPLPLPAGGDSAGPAAQREDINPTPTVKDISSALEPVTVAAWDGPDTFIIGPAPPPPVLPSGSTVGGADYGDSVGAPRGSAGAASAGAVQCVLSASQGELLEAARSIATSFQRVKAVGARHPRLCQYIDCFKTNRGE